MQTRTVALIAGASAAVALTVTGVTYASADSPQTASSVREAVRPASAPLGGDSDFGHEKDGYKKDHHGHKRDGGEIQINERTYSADPGACITVVPGVATTFNVTNNTHRTIQFFNGSVCDLGAPLATVGPGSTSFGVDTVTTNGSFRVVD
ncbi:hypothetical protein [Streptomyces blattellae]|uniref:hypothetical protein n=1 Tax=Streptomyces blattellae TaxID=2569855 RepID=UPI0012B7ABE4|nr:hypothetical protein [Streptomyces blattellae]